MIDQLDVYKVLLPEWIFETAKDKAHLEQLVLKYMTTLFRQGNKKSFCPLCKD
jgi:hypothetical protein